MQLFNSPQEKISAIAKKNDTIILGLSGGPDSVFLFHLLINMPNAPHIVAAHVNYRLRGRDSNMDRNFVEKLCTTHKIPLEILDMGNSFKKDKTGNLEEKCRKIRYLFLEAVRRKYKAKAILTGHQLNDQIETFILNLTRGCSLKGFNAIQNYDEKRHLLRPILDISKEEILIWLSKNNIKWRLDKSNLSEDFNRNLIRIKIIPIIKKINPSFLKTIGQSITDLNENLKIIEKIINDWLNVNLFLRKESICFDLEKFLNQPEIIQKHILRELYKRIHKKSLTGTTIKEILTTLNKKNTGLHKEFGNKTWIKIMRIEKNTKKRIVVIHKNFN